MPIHKIHAFENCNYFHLPCTFVSINLSKSFWPLRLNLSETNELLNIHATCPFNATTIPAEENFHPTTTNQNRRRVFHSLAVCATVSFSGQRDGERERAKEGKQVPPQSENDEFSFFITVHHFPLCLNGAGASLYIFPAPFFPEQILPFSGALPFYRPRR